MLETIVKFLAERGALVQPDALEYLSSLPEPMDKLQAGLRRGHEVPLVVTVEHARKLTAQDGETVEEPRQLPEPAPVRSVGDGEADDEPMAHAPPAQTEPSNPGGTPSSPSPTPAGRGFQRSPPSPKAQGEPSFRQEVRKVAADVEVLLDVTGESTCEGSIEDFTKLFRDRYNRMRRMFRRRREMVGAVNISKIRDGQPVKFIGLVTEVRTTKNGHRIIEIEDDTGEAVVLAPKNEGRLIELTDSLLLDEVVGIVGHKKASRGGGGLVIMEELVRPDVRLDHQPHTAQDGSVVFVSDVHVGADTFLRDGWDSFLDWMSEETWSNGGDVRHLVINGDLVEGAGIYPGQEEELHIPSVVDQCKAAADDLARLPEELSIYLLPGNHDPVRPAEPQPAFPEELRELFTPNVRFLGNPCAVSFSGVEALCYHGVSLFDYFEALSNCNIHKPIQTMEEMLRRRHLCPIYGGKTPLAPEHRDYLCIDRVPDVFVTGHVHTAQTGEYRGTRLINASTWQEQTDYQRMMGFAPDPCKAFKVDLSDLAVQTYLFDHAEGTGAVQVDNPEAPGRKLAQEAVMG